MSRLAWELWIYPPCIWKYVLYTQYVLEGHSARHSSFSYGGVSRLRQASYSNVADPPSQLRIHVRTNSALRPLASNTIQTPASATAPPPHLAPPLLHHPTPASQVCACHWHQNITPMPPLLIDTCILVTKVLYLDHHITHLSKTLPDPRIRGHPYIT